MGTSPWALDRLLTLIFAAAALAGCGTGPEAPCKCHIDVGAIDLTCGQTICSAGVGYRCVSNANAQIAPEVCGSIDAAMCAPGCGGKHCGDDGCGGSCGTCGANQSCDNGACKNNCTPDCKNKACGDDGCGGSCGTCGANQSCQNGACKDNCTPDCKNKTCGDDGCGGSCGTCKCPDCGISQCQAGQCMCTPVKHVFVTGQGVTGALAQNGGGNTGLEGADNLCKSAAKAANLAGNYVAWLSSGGTNAIDRIMDVGAWYLPGTCKRAFANKAALTGPGPDVDIDRTATGVQSPPLDIWTGTKANGRADSWTCSNWTNDSQFSQGTAGIGSSANFGAGLWTETSTVPCSGKLLLICFEQ